MHTDSGLRGVLFDWDGTLLDSYHADTQAYLGMFHALGIPWGVKELERHYSPDWHRTYRAARLPKSRWGEADRLWSRFYRQQQPKLMPGARRVLQQLARRYALGLVTSGNRPRVIRQLRYFGLSRLFAARICAEDAPRRKPHPAPLLAALRRLRLDAAACVYVGDSPEDMEMARRAGVRPIAVFGRFPTHDRLRAERPCALLESIDLLVGALKNFR
jgi:HAD superfamily hydrolase (TIGR01509 family)